MRVGATAMSVSADQAKVHISDVSISNDEPVTGETVTVTAEVSNLETSNETIDIKRVQVRKSNSAKTYRRVEDIGSLAPGGSVSVPMTVSFDNPGMKSLTVYVLVQGENGDTEAYEYPVEIMYIVDNDRVTTTQLVDVSNWSMSPTGRCLQLVDVSNWSMSLREVHLRSAAVRRPTPQPDKSLLASRASL